MIISIRKLWVGGITLFPFIFISSKLSEHRKPILINHEKIHIRQQIELLVIPFYLFYLLNYLINLIKFREHDKAYKNIIFEKEAFIKERDFDYLSKRKYFSFINFYDQEIWNVTNYYFYSLSKIFSTLFSFKANKFIGR